MRQCSCTCRGLPFLALALWTLVPANAVFAWQEKPAPDPPPVNAPPQPTTKPADTPPKVTAPQKPAGKPAGEKKPADEKQGVDQDARIQQLILQLGAKKYTARVRAQFELERFGLAALDALHDAQTHDDVEIAMRASFLVRSMKNRIQWAFETDPVAVRKILKGYGQAAAPERSNRMEQLAAVSDFSGMVALCRLARYESSSALAKRAALLVMNNRSKHPDPTALAKIAKKGAGNSRRSSAVWLATFAATLENPSSQLNNWDRLTKEEIKLLESHPDQTNRGLIKDLLRWHSDLLRSLGRDQDAVVVIRRSIDLLDGSYQTLLETVGWLIEGEAWDVVLKLAKRFPTEFEKRPILMYRLAETHLKLGDKTKAETAAAAARKIDPSNAQTHTISATDLRNRGLVEWAIDEYKHILTITKGNTQPNILGRLLLSELLHDIDRDKEAADTLEVVVKAMEDKNVERLIQTRFSRTPDAIRSRMHFFRALHLASTTDRDQQKASLESALSNDSNDADVLIAMFRMKNADDPWKKKTSARILASTNYFRTQIKRYDDLLKTSNNSNAEALKSRLALYNNQLAWLISNTEGNFDEAIRCSHRSLELMPDRSGYLDTLGRCYYAKGDLKNAVKYQSRAVELEPSSNQIRRQLQLFINAEESSQKKKPDNKTTDSDSKGGTAKKDGTSVKKEAVKKEAVKKEAVKKEAVKKEAVKKEAVKKEAVKKEAVKKPSAPGVAIPRNRFPESVG